MTSKLLDLQPFMTSFVQHADTYDDRVGIACLAICYNIVKSLGYLPDNIVTCNNACGTAGQSSQQFSNVEPLA